MIKESIHQEDIIIVNVYALNNRAPHCMKQALAEMKEDINNSTKWLAMSIAHYQKSMKQLGRR